LLGAASRRQAPRGRALLREDTFLTGSAGATKRRDARRLHAHGYVSLVTARFGDFGQTRFEMALTKLDRLGLNGGDEVDLDRGA
jgi:hypothetical protein